MLGQQVRVPVALLEDMTHLQHSLKVVCSCLERQSRETGIQCRCLALLPETPVLRDPTLPPGLPRHQTYLCIHSHKRIKTNL